MFDLMSDAPVNPVGRHEKQSHRLEETFGMSHDVGPMLCKICHECFGTSGTVGEGIRTAAVLLQRSGSVLGVVLKAVAGGAHQEGLDLGPPAG